MTKNPGGYAMLNLSGVTSGNKLAGASAMVESVINTHKPVVATFDLSIIPLYVSSATLEDGTYTLTAGTHTITVGADDTVSFS